MVGVGSDQKQRRRRMGEVDRRLNCVNRVRPTLRSELIVYKERKCFCSAVTSRPRTCALTTQLISALQVFVGVGLAVCQGVLGLPRRWFGSFRHAMRKQFGCRVKRRLRAAEARVWALRTCDAQTIWLSRKETRWFDCLKRQR